MTRALVIGYGSIGQRHTRLLAGMGCQTGVVTKQDITPATHYADLGEALRQFSPDYVVVANETRLHRKTVEKLAEAGFSGRLLVEKPLSSSPWKPHEGHFARFAVAYNLRFHPVIAALREQIEGAEVLAIDMHAGQHLSQWRPGRDYRSTYSARLASGGGVLRDLSHELDYLLWLFGPWRRVTALGGNLQALDIAADEYWTALMELQQGTVVHLRLSYLDRPARREILVATKRSTITADLMAGTLSVDGHIEHYPAGRDDSYLAMHDAMLNGDMDRLCSGNQALAVGNLIAAIERAGETGDWIGI